MNRESFVFYKDWSEAIKDLPNDVRLEVYDSIVEYALSGKQPQLKPLANIAFNFIKPQIDRNHQRYENGKKGGAPKGNKNAKKTTENNQKQPNENENENVNDNVNVNIKGVKKTSVFTPPSIQDIIEYCKSRKNNVDAIKFHNFYSAKGWMIGKNKMKDWRAAIRTWETEENKKGGSNDPNYSEAM